MKDNREYKVVGYSRFYGYYESVTVIRKFATLEEAETQAKIFNDKNTHDRKYIVVHESKMNAFMAEIDRRNAIVRKALTAENKKRYARSTSYAHSLFTECNAR